MTIVGSEKIVVYDDVSADAKVVVYDVGVRQTTPRQDGCVARELPDLQRVPAAPAGRRRPAVETRLRRTTQDGCQHFVDCNRRETPLTDGRRDSWVVRALEAAQRNSYV